MSSLGAGDIVSMLDLIPHPEGGYYRETFRDPQALASGRAASTAIYFLLPAGIVSRWHRIDATEVWHWYAGAALELILAGESSTGAERSRFELGCDFAAGQRPQAVVPAGYWQQARSLGAWTLAGCTVAPGFQFDRFELAPPGFEP